MLRTILLAVLAALMLAASLLTWGSVGALVLLFGLVMMAASLLYQRFLTNREDDTFQED